MVTSCRAVPDLTVLGLIPAGPPLSSIPHDVIHMCPGWTKEEGQRESAQYTPGMSSGAFGQEPKSVRAIPPEAVIGGKGIPLPTDAPKQRACYGAGNALAFDRFLTAQRFPAQLC